MSTLHDAEQRESAVNAWICGDRGPALDLILGQDTATGAALATIRFLADLEFWIGKEAFFDLVRELNALVDFERRDARSSSTLSDTTAPPA